MEGPDQLALEYEMHAAQRGNTHDGIGTREAECGRFGVQTTINVYTETGSHPGRKLTNATPPPLYLLAVYSASKFADSGTVSSCCNPPL